MRDILSNPAAYGLTVRVPPKKPMSAAVAVLEEVEVPLPAEKFDSTLSPWQQQIRAVFEVGDLLHIKLIHGTRTWTDKEGNVREEQEEHWYLFEDDEADQAEFFEKLKGYEEAGWNIFICIAVFNLDKMNGILETNANTKGVKLPRRTSENIAIVGERHIVRAVAIDCDADGEASLAAIHEAVAAGTIPAPTLVIRSSTPAPGTDGVAKYHVWWAVEGFTLAQQEATNSALQLAFGGDVQAKDTVRVLRLAGFANRKAKYPHKPVATIVESSTGRYTLEQFKLPLEVKTDNTARPKASSDYIEYTAGQIEENAEKAGFDLGDAKSYFGTGLIWVQKECPMGHTHSEGKRAGSCLMVLPSGARKFRCFHTHCADLDWAWFKNHLDELAGESLDWTDRGMLITPDTATAAEEDTTTGALTATESTAVTASNVATATAIEDALIERILKMNITPGERGLVDLFDTAYGDKFSFVVTRTKGEWMMWNGKIWTSTTRGRIFEHVTKLADLLKNKVIRRLPPDLKEDEDERGGEGEKSEKLTPRKLLRKVIASLNKVSDANKVVIWMESRREMMRADFDKKPFLFNFNNGTFDLETLEFRGFDRADLLTQISSVSYRPGATCPTFETFLVNAWPSLEMREYIQRAFGYCLSDDWSEKAALIMHGGGDNGKSIFLKIMMAIFGYEGEGAYAKSCAWATFDVNKSGSLTIRDDLARLHNARLVVCDESDKRMEIAQALFKAVTGGSLITSRGLFRDLFTYIATFKTVLATNHRPKITGNDPATWARIHDVPMKHSYYKGNPKRIKNLETLLMSEREGIVCWLIEGWKKYKAAGALNPPQEVLDATNEYRLCSDIQARFFNDKCIVGDGLKDLVSTLHNAHKSWSDEVGEPHMSRTEFEEMLSENGFKVRQWVAEHGQPYYAIGLKTGQVAVQAPVEAEHDPENEVDL